MAECPISELDEAYCDHCRGRRTRSRPAQRQPSEQSDLIPDPKPFEAHYTTPCAAGCGQLIEPGDLIVGTSEGYTHEECA